MLYFEISELIIYPKTILKLILELDFTQDILSLEGNQSDTKLQQLLGSIIALDPTSHRIQIGWQEY